MQTNELRFADRMSGISSGIVRDVLALSNQPGIISFSGGNPGSFALPHEQVADLAKALLLKDGKRLLQYASSDGLPELIETLTEYIRSEFEAVVSSEEVLPVSGSSQAMDILCKAYLNKGDTVLVENPTFLGNIQCIRLYEAKIIPVETDMDGLDTDVLESAIKLHHPRMLYTIPTFQNPTGVTMSLQRRKKVALLASRYKVLIAEDDPYHSLRYSGNPLPSIKSFDRDSWVMLIGSFSKVIAPGLRVGFMAGDKRIIAQCKACKLSADVFTPSLNQAIVSEFIRQGLLQQNVERIKPIYKNLQKVMLEELNKIPEIISYTKPQGGLFIWASLNERQNAGTLFRSALKAGVAIVPGEPFFPDGGHVNTFRLNFSKADESAIRQGMAILADNIKKLRDQEG